MLTVKGLAKDQYKYYLAQVQDDRLKNQRERIELDGVWLGEGSERLGLSGIVKRNHLRNIFDGYAPRNRTEKLVVNAGMQSRNAAWDLTLSAPKPISIFSALLGESMERDVILKSDFEAVEQTLKFLSKYVQVRSVKHDVDQAPNLVYAVFQHLTSREYDPHLHTHCCLINVNVLPYGETGAISAAPLYKLQLVGGAIYRAELAHRLEERLGLPIIRKKSWFDIEGFPESITNNFSKRRNAILNEVIDKEMQGKYASQIARYATKREKEHFALSELYKMWAAEAKSHLFTEQDIRALFGRSNEHDPSLEMQLLINTVSSRLSNLNRDFTNRIILQYVAEEAQGRGINAKQILAIAEAYMQSDDVILKKKYNQLLVFERSKDVLVKQIEPPVQLIQTGKVIRIDSDRQKINPEGSEQQPLLRLTM